MLLDNNLRGIFVVCHLFVNDGDKSIIFYASLGASSLLRED